jgi:hypothetical protein
MRRKAALLASTIPEHHRDFTVHDISHLDALWELSDLIGGQSLIITPAEAFILGGAFLLHDLGMSLASYPGGIESLKKTQAWAEAETAILRDELGRTPTETERLARAPEAERTILGVLLRNQHAAQAERLAAQEWFDPNGNPHYLIDDPELREQYGPLIGRIAHSHWWSASALVKEFGTIPLGNLPDFPREWKVDALKLAFLLRLADVAHLDSRRAPHFLRIVRAPSGVAADHWLFQSRLHFPQVIEDQLVYTSGSAFMLEEASAWWLCFDTLREADRELRQVDRLLSDLGRQRFAARGVARVDDPARLAELIRTRGWIPIDTEIRASRVTQLVKRLGGAELYGRNAAIAIRELIQNSCDAVRARRRLENRADTWGDVYVRLGRDDQGEWLEIRDTGIGMSQEVLLGPLLDFGLSYWGTPMMLRDFPGLLSSGFEPTGKYGIGFFSAFMLGTRVQLTTRRYDAAQRETDVLEFSKGVDARPILRSAEPAEYLADGGTIVKVWLDAPSEAPDGLLHSAIFGRLGPVSLTRLCAALCPSIDTNLSVEDSGAYQQVVRAGDWLEIQGDVLLARIWALSLDAVDDRRKKLLRLLGDNLRILHDRESRPAGRACIVPDSIGKQFRSGYYQTGAITVGGLQAAGLAHVGGILLGTSIQAARNSADVLANGNALADWAAEQAALIVKLRVAANDLQVSAGVIWQLGAKPGSLPIARSADGWLSYADIAQWKDAPPIIYLCAHLEIQSGVYRMSINDAPELLRDNVLLALQSFSPVMENTRSFISQPDDMNTWRGQGPTLSAAVISALAEAWEVQLGDVLSASELQNDARRQYPLASRDGEEVFGTAWVIRKPIATTAIF